MRWTISAVSHSCDIGTRSVEAVSARASPNAKWAWRMMTWRCSASSDFSALRADSGALSNVPQRGEALSVTQACGEVCK